MKLLKCLIRRTLLGACVVSLHACATTSSPVNHAASVGTAIEASDGTSVRPFDGAANSLVAFVFVSHECPIANAMMPDIIAIARTAKQHGVRLYAVHSSGWVDLNTVRSHADAFALTPAATVLHDQSQDIARAIGATITPEAALIRLDGHGGFERLYLGRVNDLYAGIGRRKANPTSNDFADALSAALTDHAIASPQPKAIGCFIELQPHSRY